MIIKNQQSYWFLIIISVRLIRSKLQSLITDAANMIQITLTLVHVDRAMY